jgi:hypothetical protein
LTGWRGRKRKKRKKEKNKLKMLRRRQKDTKKAPKVEKVEEEKPEALPGEEVNIQIDEVIPEPASTPIKKTENNLTLKASAVCDYCKY